MRQIQLHILSQTRGENASPPLEQRVNGKMAVKEGVSYAFYKENAEGLEGVRTTLKWKDNWLVISRSGAVESRQEFRPGYRCSSVYKTPYLIIPLVSTTRRLTVAERGRKHRLEVEYDLAHGNDYYGRMEIIIEIEEVEA